MIDYTDLTGLIYTAATTAERGMPIYYAEDAEFVLHKKMGRELVENLIKQQVRRNTLKWV